MRFFYPVISPSNLRFLSRCRLFNALSPKPQESAATHVLRRNVLSMNVAVNREAFRQAVANTLERRLFYIPSFKIYRGVAGLYDYGPPGCAVKANVLAFWRQVCSGSVGDRFAVSNWSNPYFVYKLGLWILIWIAIVKNFMPCWSWN